MSTQSNYPAGDDENAQDTHSHNSRTPGRQSHKHADLIQRARVAIEGMIDAVDELEMVVGEMQEEFIRRSLPLVDYSTQHWLRDAAWEVLSLAENMASKRADIEEWNKRIQDWEPA